MGKRRFLLMFLVILLIVNAFSSNIIVGKTENNSEYMLYGDPAKLTPANGGGASGGGGGGTVGTLFILITYDYLDHTLNELKTNVFEKIDTIVASTWNEVVKKAQEIYNSIFNSFKRNYYNVEGDYDVFTR
jgi:hypothetical protein